MNRFSRTNVVVSNDGALIAKRLERYIAAGIATLVALHISVRTDRLASEVRV